jgi:hypothetical protein
MFYIELQVKGAIVMTDNWNDEASSILKGALKRKRVKYSELADRLNELGNEETRNSIANKLSRGTFSFAFFLQCMKVLRINKISLD